MKAKITEAQAKFLKIETRGGIYKGGIGAGKSKILCIDNIRDANNYGDHCAIISFSYPSLRDTIQVAMNETLEEWGFIPELHFTFNKTEMNYFFPHSGGKIMLRSGDKPDSLRGLNLNKYSLDEAREFPDDSIHKIMLGRLRRQGKRGWRIASTTKGKSWFYELEKSEGVTVVKQTTFENPFLPQDYIDDLLANYTSEYARQELYAEEIDFGAGLIKRHWFIIEDEKLEGRRIRSWDLAVTEKKTSDYSAGGLICMANTGKAQIQDMKHCKKQWPELKEIIVQTALADGTSVPIVLEKAGQQIGLINDLQRDPRLGAFTVNARSPAGSKVARAMPWISRLEQGRITLLAGGWNEHFISEAELFSGDDSHSKDDQLDSVSQAWAEIQNAPAQVLQGLW